MEDELGTSIEDWLTDSGLPRRLEQAIVDVLGRQACLADLLRAEARLAARGVQAVGGVLERAVRESLIDLGQARLRREEVAPGVAGPALVRGVVGEPPWKERAAVEAWADRQGVRDALALSLPAIAHMLPYGEIPKPLAEVSVLDLVTDGERARSVLHARALLALRERLRGDLVRLARMRAEWTTHEARFLASLRSPEGASLARVHARLVALYREQRACLCPLPPFETAAVELREHPLRLIVQSHGSAIPGFLPPRRGTAALDVAVEHGVPACDCEAAAEGPCVHRLSLVHACLSWLGRPGRARDRLVEVLSVPAWQRLLGKLERLSSDDETAPPSGRIVWRLHEDNPGQFLAVPYLQKARRGGFTSGSRIDAGSIASERVPGADDADLHVASQIALGRQDHRAGPRVLTALIGHPRVLLDGARPLEVRPARVGLRVKEAPGEALHLIATLDGLPIELEALAPGRHGVLDAERGRLWVIAREPALDALLSALAETQSLPAEARDGLLERLPALLARLPVELPASLEGERVDADPEPMLRLRLLDPIGVGGWVVVRPVGTSLQVPGAGDETVHGVREGRRVTASRGLDEELRRAHELAGELGLSVDSGFAFRLDDEVALALCETLREREQSGCGPRVEWDGARPTVLRKLRATDVRLSVRRKRDWFGLEGELEVDGARVELAVLLDALRSGRRFVALDGQRFVALEDSLRERLGAFADVVQQGRGGLELWPEAAAALEALAEEGVAVDAEARWQALCGRLSASRTLVPEIPAGLTATLRPYQREGFDWLMRLASWGVGGCLCDDMGLGKTVQALAVLLARAAAGPALVIAPTSVCGNWRDEAARFAPSLRLHVHRGETRAELASLRPGDVLVTSYGIVVRDAEALSAVRFSTLVLDEAQAIKNPGTQRARAVRNLDAELRVALSGTPVENHLGELWSLFRAVVPGLLGSLEQFRDRFARPIERERDPERQAALARTIRPFLLRRTKAQVAPELPPRTEIRLDVELSVAERHLYEDARLAILARVGGKVGKAEKDRDPRFEALAGLMRLRRLACHPRLYDESSDVPSSKLAEVLRLCTDLREGGHRALVFSQFTSHLALARPALEAAGFRCLSLEGATPPLERERLVARFQAGQGDLFLISLKAGGTGLNLTAADYVVHLDPWWNPAVEDQATDRAHRIGQDKPVTVYRLVARGTVEDAILSLHAEKRELAAALLDGGDIAGRLSTEELLGLIRG